LSVPSQGQGDYQYGFRVPLLVVSAYTPVGYVDNLRYDFGSIHRFIEQNLGIPEGALGFADARATNDLTTFINWNQQPRKFQHISAPLDASFFINDKSPVEPLDSYWEAPVLGSVFTRAQRLHHSSTQKQCPSISPFVDCER